MRPPVEREDKAVKKAGRKLFSESPSSEEEEMDMGEVEAYDPTKVKPVGSTKTGSVTSGSRGSSRRGSVTAAEKKPARDSAAQQAFNAQLVEEAKARRQQKIDADLAREMAKKLTPPSGETTTAGTPEKRGSAPTPPFSPLSHPDEDMPGPSGVAVWADDVEEEEKIYEVADPDKPVNVGEAVVADLHLLEQGPEDMELGEEEAPPTHFHIEGEAVVADPTTGQIVPPTPAPVPLAPTPAAPTPKQGTTAPVPPPVPPAPTTAPLAQAIEKAKKKRAEAKAAEAKAAEAKPAEEKTAEAKPAPDKESEAEGVGKQPSPQKTKTPLGEKDE